MAISKASGIKSIQRIAMTMTSGQYTTTAAIAAVNMSKTQLRLLGVSGYSTNGNLEETGARIWLDSATQVSAVRGAAGAYAMSLTVEITESY